MPRRSGRKGVTTPAPTLPLPRCRSFSLPHRARAPSAQTPGHPHHQPSASRELQLSVPSKIFHRRHRESNIARTSAAPIDDRATTGAAPTRIRARATRCARCPPPKAALAKPSAARGRPPSRPGSGPLSGPSQRSVARGARRGRPSLRSVSQVRIAGGGPGQRSVCGCATRVSGGRVAGDRARDLRPRSRHGHSTSNRARRQASGRQVGVPERFETPRAAFRRRPHQPEFWRSESRFSGSSRSRGSRPRRWTDRP
jgi:hypothetical protein